MRKLLSADSRQVCVVSEHGKEAVVALHGNGDFFGESCLNGHPLRVATAVAVTECVIMRIERAAIVRVLHDEPKFSERFMAYLLARNSRVEEDLVDQLFNSSEKRLARVLLLMANFGKESKPEPVIAKISQETLAEMVGTTRSRVSMFMNKFRKLGFIEYNGELKIEPDGDQRRCDRDGQRPLLQVRARRGRRGARSRTRHAGRRRGRKA